ncbi:MAG: sulfur carrier protein ThiS [Burkholderiales bacterium]
MAVTINGEPRQFESAVSLAQLLERLDLAGRKIAIDRNGEIVPRSRFGEQTVDDGDRLEIVVAVGGG